MRVLFALTPQVRELFLPRLHWETYPDFMDIRLDPSGLDAREWKEHLRDIRPDIIVSGWSTPKLPSDMEREEGQPLRYICHLAGTVRSIVTRGHIESGLLVTNWGTAISHTIAEHALLLVLGSLRSTSLWRSCMEEGIFGASPAGQVLRTRSLQGKRVGIHGFGTIAREVVARLRPFGVTVSAYSQGVPPEVFDQAGVGVAPSLPSLFATSDILIECEALTPATTGCVTRALLELLPEDAVFVNVARGALVDEAALARLALAGKIRVALDVYRKEPLAEDNLLRHIPNALLSPHCAGPTDDACPLAGNFALENLRHYLSGNSEQLQGVVTAEIYDRIT